mmetsp:Transcript_50003/g.128711  ORF Transcript_50003/g.128711 Transcript_50003/m.128711 type:complete len:234 (+) Transcript_50003:1760-2461(+)
MKRRLAIFVLRVHVRPLLEKKGSHAGTVSVSGIVQRSHAVFIRFLYFGRAGRQEGTETLLIAVSDEVEDVLVSLLRSFLWCKRREHRAPALLFLRPFIRCGGERSYKINVPLLRLRLVHPLLFVPRIPLRLACHVEKSRPFCITITHSCLLEQAVQLQLLLITQSGQATRSFSRIFKRSHADSLLYSCLSLSSSLPFFLFSSLFACPLFFGACLYHCAATHPGYTAARCRDVM